MHILSYRCPPPIRYSAPVRSRKLSFVRRYFGRLGEPAQAKATRVREAHENQSKPSCCSPEGKEVSSMHVIQGRTLHDLRRDIGKNPTLDASLSAAPRHRRPAPRRTMQLPMESTSIPLSSQRLMQAYMSTHSVQPGKYSVAI